MNNEHRTLYSEIAELRKRIEKLENKKVEKEGISLDFTPETRTLDFVEKIKGAFFIYFKEKSYFYCHPNNLNYGVYNNNYACSIDKNNLAVFEKKQFKDLKDGDVWFEDKEEIKIYDVNFMINKNNNNVNVYYDSNYNGLNSVKYYEKDDYIWVARRE